MSLAFPPLPSNILRCSPLATIRAHYIFTAVLLMAFWQGMLVDGSLTAPPVAVIVKYFAFSDIGCISQADAMTLCGQKQGMSLASIENEQELIASQEAATKLLFTLGVVASGTDPFRIGGESSILQPYTWCCGAAAGRVIWDVACQNNGYCPWATAPGSDYCLGITANSGWSTLPCSTSNAQEENSCIHHYICRFVAWCSVGYYLDSTSNNCEPCAAGTISNTTNAVECTKCGKGTVSGAAGSACIKCPPGFYSPEAGSPDCKYCLAGTSSTEYGRSEPCPQCPPGTYAASPSEPCIPCPVNTFNKNSGADAVNACTPCPLGAHAPPGAAHCTLTAEPSTSKSVVSSISNVVTATGFTLSTDESSTHSRSTSLSNDRSSTPTHSRCATLSSDRSSSPTESLSLLRTLSRSVQSESQSSFSKTRSTSDTQLASTTRSFPASVTSTHAATVSFDVIVTPSTATLSHSKEMSPSATDFPTHASISGTRTRRPPLSDSLSLSTSASDESESWQASQTALASGSGSATGSGKSWVVSHSTTSSLDFLRVALVGPFSEYPVACLMSNSTTKPALFITLRGDAFIERPLCTLLAAFSGSGAVTAQYATGNITAQVLNASTVALTLRAQPSTAQLQSPENITVSLQPCILASNRWLRPIYLTLIPSPQPVAVISPAVMQATKAVGSASAAISGVVASPVAATQASRTTLILDAAACEPSFDDLDFWQSPTQVRLGSGPLAMHTAGALLNHVLIGGTGLILALCGLAHSRRTKEPLSSGLRWARFPSLCTVPVMILLEPTAMCASTLLIHGGPALPSGRSRLVCILCDASGVRVVPPPPSEVWRHLHPQSRYRATALVERHRE